MWVTYLSLNWQFWFFGRNLPKNGMSGLKQKICTFPHGGRYTQQHFNVSFTLVTETIKEKLITHDSLKLLEISQGSCRSVCIECNFTVFNPQDVSLFIQALGVQRCIQNTVKHISWNFLRIELTAENSYRFSQKVPT